ncbi:hypothetical protein [Rossellomorea aquimaris]|uniref:hypothetical protein n=1 Tax=Rossellomorea aquimaris TaxID=189382 RepID=UPI000AB6E680|nr:hypothetical protein [Rossellomorea aquimaris]
MVIYYDDANEDTHRVTGIDHFNKGYQVESIITLQEVDEDGNLNIDIEENSNY